MGLKMDILEKKKGLKQGGFFDVFLVDGEIGNRPQKMDEEIVSNLECFRSQSLLIESQNESFKKRNQANKP